MGLFPPDFISSFFPGGGATAFILAAFLLTP